MKGINKLAAVLCLLMLPSTVFAAQTDRPQHPKMVITNNNTQNKSAPKETKAVQVTVNAPKSSPIKKSIIPDDVLVIEDAWNDSDRKLYVDSLYTDHGMGGSWLMLQTNYTMWCSDLETYFLTICVRKERTSGLLTASTNAELSMSDWNGKGYVNLLSKPTLIIVKAGEVKRKPFPKLNHSLNRTSVTYKINKKFLHDAALADETYIEMMNYKNQKVWVKIMPNIVKQLNEILERNKRLVIKNS